MDALLADTPLTHFSLLMAVWNSRNDRKCKFVAIYNVKLFICWRTNGRTDDEVMYVINEFM